MTTQTEITVTTDPVTDHVTITLTCEQAMHIANTLAWNVDLDTVEDDDWNTGGTRADTVRAFRDAVRDTVQDAVRDLVDPR
jgi:hypothetical protein